MTRIMLMAVLLAGTSACGRGPEESSPQEMGGRPGESVTKAADARAQAGDTNAAALNSANPNTLQPGDLTNSTSDVGGGAAVDNAPTTPR